MAKVEYQRQPTVTVHGVPADEYADQAGQGTAPGQQPGGGGIVGNIKQHWPVYTVVLGVVTILVIIWINRGNNTSASSANQGSTGGLPGGVGGDQLYGAQLDADYQQMMNFQNTEIGLLQQLINQGKNPSSNPPKAGTILPGGGTGLPPPKPITTNNSFLPGGGNVLGKMTQIIQKSNKKTGQSAWYEYTPGIGSMPLSNLFPKGTKFFGGGGGQAYYQLPGGQKTLFGEAGSYGHQYY